MWEGVKYECIGMPFGLAPAPRLSTKLFAPVLRYLRRQGLRISVYILHRRPDHPGSLYSAVHRPHSVGGGHTSSSRLLRPSGEVLLSAPPLSRVPGHTGEQQEDAISGAASQASKHPQGGAVGLQDKRPASSHGTTSRKSSRLAQCSPAGSDFCTASPVAVPSSSQVSLSSLFLDGLYRYTGHRGDAVVARRDARLVGQVDHPGAGTDGGDDRCLQPQLERVVATVRPNRQSSQ